MFDNIKTPPATLASRDGYERIWGEGIPEMSEAVKEMLHDWKEKEDFDKIMLFFMGKCDYSEERSGYLLRELMRGYI